MTKFQNIENIKKFLFAGNATITLESKTSGKHLTFKVKASDSKSNPCYFVSLLTGSDNESNYTYLGTIFNRKEFRITKKSKITDNALSFKSFNFFFNNVLSNRLNNNLSVYHSGICGRCGRKLTTPSSIEAGMGPECAKSF